MFGERCEIARVECETVAAFSHEVRRATAPSGDQHRQTARHRFVDDEAPLLGCARMNKSSGESIETRQFVVRPGSREMDASLNAKRHQPPEDKEWDEFDHEKFMRECDARTDKYGELLDKYIDHPERHRIIAREMGWTWLEEAR